MKQSTRGQSIINQANEIAIWIVDTTRPQFLVAYISIPSKRR